MSMRSVFLTGAACAGLMLMASPASATHTITLSGVITDGHDDTGIFGAPGALTGDSVVVKLVEPPGGAPRDTVPGVSDNLGLYSVTVTIKGASLLLDEQDIVSVFAALVPGELAAQYVTSVDADPVWQDSFSALAFSPLIVPDLDISTGGFIPVTGTGAFGTHVCCCPDCGPDFPDRNTGGSIAWDLLSIGVPEPRVWALMLGGFGLAGLVFRRRRAVPA